MVGSPYLCPRGHGRRFLYVRDICTTPPRAAGLLLPHRRATRLLEEQMTLAVQLYDNEGDLRRLRDITDEIFVEAICLCNGNVSEAARALGIGRSTMYRHIQIKGNHIFRSVGEELT
jgi:DNA-binding NtrC family response regulator